MGLVRGLRGWVLREEGREEDEKRGESVYRGTDFAHLLVGTRKLRILSYCYCYF